MSIHRCSSISLPELFFYLLRCPSLLDADWFNLRWVVVRMVCLTHMAGEYAKNPELVCIEHASSIAKWNMMIQSSPVHNKMRLDLQLCWPNPYMDNFVRCTWWQKHALAKTTKRIWFVYSPSIQKDSTKLDVWKKQKRPMPVQFNKLRVRKRPQRTIHRVRCKACACK